MRDSTRKELTLSSFLQTLNFSALGLSEDFIQATTEQYESTLENFGVIRQKLIEQKLSPQIDKFDKLMEKEVKKTFVKETTLYPNHIPSEAFGLSSVISDPHAKLLGMDDEFLSRCFEGKIVSVSYGNNKIAKFGYKDIEPGYFMGTIQEFLELMKGWLNPRIIQHWCVLWNWACQNQSFVFPYVPIDDILATVYSRPKSGYFCMRDRQAFSRTLDFLHNATLEVPIVVETEGKNGKKKREEAIRLFRLFNLDLAKKNKKGDVYLKVTGELLPGLNVGRFRGRIFPKGIFELDSGREGNRIVLAYRICNRQDQLQGEPIQWSKEELIKAASLEATYNQHKGMGCYELTRTLQRLVEVKCIGGIEPEKITAGLIKPVTIYSFLD